MPHHTVLACLLMLVLNQTRTRNLRHSLNKNGNIRALSALSVGCTKYVYLQNITPDTTPYRSGLPIDACPESDKDEKSPTFLEQKRKYQSIVGSIGWLAQSTCPDLSPSHLFLSAYINKPSQSHLNAALYVLHYIHSMIDYGFTFTSAEKSPLHTYMTFPHSSDTKAYEDALPPWTNQHHRLTTYSNACWGSQIGNAIREGIHLPLFKF